MKLKKVKIIIHPLEDVKEEWKRAIKGEVDSIQKNKEIVFLSLESLSKVLSPARLVILTAVFKRKPKSIYALAKLVNRDFKNVHADVKFLAEAGLLDLKVQGVR